MAVTHVLEGIMVIRVFEGKLFRSEVVCAVNEHDVYDYTKV